MKIANYLETRAHQDLWSIRPGETLYSFADELCNYSVGALTVLDDEGSLLGIISERDLVRAIAEHGAKSLQMTVADFMTCKVVTCSPEDDMLQTLELMNTYGIRHMPVMKEGRPWTIIGLREFDAACQELKELANTDALTGIPNRRHFISVLSKDIERHRRNESPLSLAALSLDCCQKNGNGFDREAGDDLLVWLAQLLAKEFRTYDSIGRLSDETFAVMFSNSDIQEAEAACERLGRAVRREEAMTRYGGVPVTISQGLTSIHRYRVSANEILDVADALLTEAKNTGRNRINSRSYLLVTDSGVSFSV